MIDQVRQDRGRMCGWRRALVAAAIFLGAASMTGTCALAQDKDGAGVVLSLQASSKDVGLPIYPGATPHTDPKDESGAGRIGLWGGSFGFKLAALKMDTGDSMQKVANYYKKALAGYGNVLDCTNAPASDRGKDDSSTTLTCGDDRSDKGGMFFKAGTKEKQHLVAMKPNGTGTTFTLVYIWLKGN
jgi:hypothetical protein